MSDEVHLIWFGMYPSEEDGECEALFLVWSLLGQPVRVRRSSIVLWKCESSLLTHRPVPTLPPGGTSLLFRTRASHVLGVSSRIFFILAWKLFTRSIQVE